MRNPVPPFFLSQPGDLSIFASLERMCRSVEAVDVKDNSYVAFDSLGARIELRVVNERSPGKWFFFLTPVITGDVVARWSDAEPRHESELRERMYRVLQLHGDDEIEVLKSLPLNELVARVLRYKPILE